MYAPWIHSPGLLSLSLLRCCALTHAQVDVNAPESEAKKSLIEDIRRYIEVQIIAADKSLEECAVQKVSVLQESRTRQQLIRDGRRLLVRGKVHVPAADKILVP